MSRIQGLGGNNYDSGGGDSLRFNPTEQVKKEADHVARQSQANQHLADNSGKLSRYRDTARLLAVAGMNPIAPKKPLATKKNGLTNLDSRKANPSLRELLHGASRLGDLAA